MHRTRGRVHYINSGSSYYSEGNFINGYMNEGYRCGERRGLLYCTH
jgi:hypothetical protein